MLLSCFLSPHPPPPWVCALRSNETGRDTSPLQPPAAALAGRASGGTHLPLEKTLPRERDAWKGCGHQSLNSSSAEGIATLSHPHPLDAVGMAIPPRKAVLTFAGGAQYTHRAQHRAGQGGVLAMIQTAMDMLKTVTAILSSPEQN